MAIRKGNVLVSSDGLYQLMLQSGVKAPDAMREIVKLKSVKLSKEEKSRLNI